MTALDVRPAEPELDLSPWTCPRCGYANDGIRGFCAGCRRQRPVAESRPVAPQPLPPAKQPWSPPGPAAGSRGAPSFSVREIVATVCVAVLFVSGVFAAITRA